MNYKYNDGGRAAAGFRGKTGDCVTRAIAIAMELPYQQVYDAMADGNAQQRSARGRRYNHSVMRRDNSGTRTAREGIDTRRKWFKEWMASRGWEWIPTMKIGSGCTVHLDANELPMGRIIVAVSKHYCAVIDGVIHDTFDPNDRGVTIYPPSHPNVPKSATWLANGNGWAYAPKRCVYGYWVKAS